LTYATKGRPDNAGAEKENRKKRVLLTGERGGQLILAEKKGKKWRNITMLGEKKKRRRPFRSD